MKGFAYIKEQKEERQMSLTVLKRALVSGGLPMNYKVDNPWAPRRCGTRQHKMVFISKDFAEY